MRGVNTLKDKIILITGASSGIGRETAIECDRRGASLVLIARRIERLREVAAQLRSSLAIKADAGNEEEVSAAVRTALNHFGSIDVLINNAGSGLYAKVEETTPEQMERLWRTNVMGTFLFTRCLLPHFKERGIGHILTVSSMTGRRGAAFKGAYSATKFAQIGLMESLRMELKGSRIYSTLVFPGSTNTEFVEAMENPSGRDVRYFGGIKTPDIVARAIANAIEKPAVEVITQRLGRIHILVNALSPSLADWLVMRTTKSKQSSE